MPVEEGKEGGMSWLEIGSLFEQRTGGRMPRRWPPDKTPEERLIEQGAAAQDHLKAFARGVGESLRWAFAEEDAALWKPRKKAQPRLTGLGITTATAAVRLEIRMTPQERSNTEDFILRLKGAKHRDVEKVKQGTIRLRESRFMPRVEFATMRGIRPEGPGTEEAQELEAEENEDVGGHEAGRGQAGGELYG